MMGRLYGCISGVAVILGLLLWIGDRPERRYENAACQYRAIYKQDTNDAMGLVTLGGSRVRVATSGDHFNAVLAKHDQAAMPVYNMSHSYFSLEKEYVLLRDLLTKRKPKTALIMIEPRRFDFGSAHPDYLEIARLKDIPLTLYTLWPEGRLAAIKAVRDIVLQHLQVTDVVGKPHKETTVNNCDRLDYRLDILKMHNADTKYRTAQQRKLQWDLNAPSEKGFLRWIEAYRQLSEDMDVELMFLLMTGTSEPLPPEGFEQAFEDVTGAKMITLDHDIHHQLSINGRRDSSHMNRIGRDVFLPWLIGRIEAKCARAAGCL